MASQLVPYLRFNDGKCAEALEFYKSIFGGTADIMTIGASPMGGDMPKDKQGLIMHSTFRSGAIAFQAADMMRDRAQIGDQVNMSVECDSEKELTDIFDRLSEGGDAFMKPEKQFWGGVFGVVTDKYGIEWLLNFQDDPMK